ncbi:MAG: hypothetical protein PVSMB4_02960 [Ktedonobacterales bacterium]
MDGGLPFTSVARHSASAGTASNEAAGTLASGYSIIEAEELDAAVAVVQVCTVLQGGARITVYETMAMM